MASLDSNASSTDPLKPVGQALRPSSTLPVTLPYEEAQGQDLAVKRLNATEEFLPQQIEEISRMLDEDALKTEPARTESSPRPLVKNGSSDAADLNEDASIEEYMARLLERVNHGVRSAVEGPPMKQETPGRVRETLSTTRTDEEPAIGEPEVGDTAEPRPSARRPEDRDDLLSLRQLANESAQGALRTHRCRQLVELMNRQLGLAISAAIGSCLLLFIASSVWSWAYSGAVLAMGAALYAGWRYLALAGQLSKVVSLAVPTPLQDESSPDA